jgi:hypothetical protein
MPPARFALTHRIRRALRNDRGAMSVFALVTIVALFAVAALVYDGAGRLRALTHAEGVAHEAARAGGLVTYLSHAGVSGTVNVSEDGGSLEVTVTESYHAVFLGGASGSVTGHGSANLVYKG